MKGTFRAALRNEFTKHSRQKLPYLGMVLVVLLAVVSMKSIRMMAGLDSDLNGFLLVIKGTIAAVTSLIPVFAVMLASVLVASETAGGTYRNVLSRPIGRAEFLTAKILFAFAYAVVLLVLYVIAALIVASVLYPFGPVLDGGEVLYPTWHIAVVFVAACLLTIVPLFAIVSYGILVSTAAKSLASAFGIGVGLLIAIEPIKARIRWGDWQLGDYVPTSYLDTALGIADQAASGFDYQWLPHGWWGSNLSWGLTLSLACSVVFLAASYLIFLRRDLNFS